MSARLVSRKPRLYASFVAVSISRVRLSGCAVLIFSRLGRVSYLTNLDHKPDAPALSTPATRQFGLGLARRQFALPGISTIRCGQLLQLRIQKAHIRQLSCPRMSWD